EERAMVWLRGRGYTPENVARLNQGWDIRCGPERFEVKGRKSKSTAIRLSENEYRAAKRFGSLYTLLIFTARTSTKLRTAVPDQHPDPAKIDSWNRRIMYEYVLVE